MSANETFEQYKNFVKKVTSDTSHDTPLFNERLTELNDEINVAQLLTATYGIAGEAGEINDLTKKILFHGKPWNDENKAKMLSEVGDMFWYLTHLMEVLGVEVEDVLDYNIKKLESRYPGGKFSIERSENRTPEKFTNNQKVMAGEYEAFTDLTEVEKEHYKKLGKAIPAHKTRQIHGTPTEADVSFKPVRNEFDKMMGDPRVGDPTQPETVDEKFTKIESTVEEADKASEIFTERKPNKSIMNLWGMITKTK